MKKLIKILAVLAAVAAVLLIAAFITLKIMFPPEKLKTMAQDYAQKSLHREVTFSDASFNLIGLTLTDFAVSERGTFADGTFIKSQRAVVKIALWPLLKKRVEISTVGLDGLDIHIIKNKDGKLNFEDLLSEPAPEAQPQEASEPKTEEEANALFISAEHIYAKNCNFYYKDLQNGMDASLANVQLNIRDFSLATPFTADLAFTADYHDKAGLTVAVPFKMALKADLGGLDMTKALLTLNQFSLTYKNIKFTAQGGAKNFEAPIIDITGKISGVSKAALADILPDLPAFTLPDILFTLSAEADLAASSAKIKQAKLELADSNITTKGNACWGNKNPAYTLTAAINLNLSQIAQMAEMLSGYGFGGLITGSLTATEKKDGQDVRGELSLNQLAGEYDPFTLSELTGTIVLKSLADISCSSLTGVLNGGKFTSSFAYKDLGSVLDILFNLDLASFTMDHFPNSDTAAKNTPQASASQPQPQEPEMLFNLKTDIKVGPVSVPYFTTEGLSLSADLKKASASMKQAGGTAAFSLQKGTIKDITLFTRENKIIKILLLPLSLINTVTSKLGINLFTEKNKEIKGTIPFTLGEGEYSFTDGLMNITKTAFNSSVSDLKATGNINFKTEALDMRVTATVLTSQTPVVIKIGGTLSDPSGKLDVVNTAASLVTGILNYKTPVKLAGTAVETTGNVAKTAINTSTSVVKGTVHTTADVVKGIGGLFKKKKKEEPTETAEDEKN